MIYQIIILERSLKLKDEYLELNTRKWSETVYYRTDESALESYKEEVEKELEGKNSWTMKSLNETLKRAADEELKKVYRRKILCNEKKEIQEPSWMNEAIRDGIK